MNIMRILITGGAGFLGHHLVEHFLKNTDAEIVVLDKLTYASSGYDRLRDIRAYDDKRVRLLGCDLSHPIPEGIRREVGGPIDYVIHAAAESHVDHSITDPMPFLQSNVIGTHHLLWWFKEQREKLHLDWGPKRIFCVSTDEVYGPASWDHPGNVPTDPFRPANPYAAAKAGGECVAMAYANTYKLPITICNTMNLLGERQHFEKYVPLVIRKVLAGETVTIHADPTRTRSGTRCYIHCRNYASAIEHLIDTDQHGLPSVIQTRDHVGQAWLWQRRDPLWRRLDRELTADELARTSLSQTDEERRQLFEGDEFAMPLKIHVSGEREISNLDLAQMIAGFVGKPLHYDMVDFHSSRPGHDLRYALDGSEIRAMGWKQPLDIEASLEKTVRWFLDNPKWLGLAS